MKRVGGVILSLVLAGAVALGSGCKKKEEAPAPPSSQENVTAPAPSEQTTPPQPSEQTTPSAETSNQTTEQAPAQSQ